jgi:hypothetical protein
VSARKQRQKAEPVDFSAADVKTMVANGSLKKLRVADLKAILSTMGLSVHRFILCNLLFVTVSLLSDSFPFLTHIV